MDNEIYQQMKDNEYEKFVENYFKPLETEEDVNEVEKIAQKHPIFHKTISLLNITNKEDAIKYRDFITNDYKLKNYFSTLNLFKTKEFIRKKELDYKKETYDERILTTSINMVSLLNKFEKHYNLNRFEFDIKKFEIENEISKDFQTLYKKLYPRKKVKDFTNATELYKIYGNMIKDISGDINTIKSSQTQPRHKGKQYRPYSIDIDKVKDIIYLCKQNNPGLNGYNLDLIETLTGIKPDKKGKVGICDEEEFYNNYLFSKTKGKN